MRPFLRAFTATLVLVVLSLPTAVYAEDPIAFYTITIGDPNGDGSSVAARQAANSDELTRVCKDYFGPKLATGEEATLYWIIVAGNRNFFYTYTVNDSGRCTIADNGKLKPGDPPGFGVDVTPPIIIGSLISLSVLLLGMAWLLYRRRKVRPRPAL